MRERRSAPAAAFALALLLLGGCTHAWPETNPAIVGLDAGTAGDDPYAAGRSALATGQPAAAVGLFRHALRAEPHSVAALNGLAIAYDELGRFDVSRSVYERALRLDPASPMTQNNLGRSLLRQGMTDAAIRLLQQAQLAAAGPDLQIIRANLASVPGPRPLTPDGTRRGASAAPAGPFRVERLGARTHLVRTQSFAAHPSHVPEFGVAAIGSTAASANELPARPFRITLANGNGRAGMAARFGRFLGEQGLAGARLTNADSYAHETSKISYRKGKEAEARQLARLLPFAVALEEEAGPATDVRLLLGHDLLGFDDRLRAVGRAG